VRICPIRSIVAAVAIAGLLAVCTARATQQDPGPFSPDVKDFVATYQKTGGE
jgi:hypothetical protein